MLCSRVRLNFDGFYTAVAEHGLAENLLTLLGAVEAQQAALAKAKACRPTSPRTAGTSIKTFTIMTPKHPREGQVQRPMSELPAHQRREKHESTHRMPDGRRYEYAFGSREPTAWEVHLEMGTRPMTWRPTGETVALPVGKGVTPPAAARHAPQLAPAPPDDFKPLPPRDKRPANPTRGAIS